MSKKEEISVILRFPIFFAISMILILCPCPSSQNHFGVQREKELQKIFKLRNENEWKSAWHSEKHVRCRDQLLSHMEWACQKDIYRLEKRPSQGLRENEIGEEMPDEMLPEFFIRKSDANSIIKPWSGYVRRKRENKSITDECCSPTGCTWEEYAEYCPAHRRIRPSRRRSQ